MIFSKAEAYAATAVPEADAERRKQDGDEELAADFAAARHFRGFRERNRCERERERFVRNKLE